MSKLNIISHLTLNCVRYPHNLITKALDYQTTTKCYYILFVNTV